MTKKINLIFITFLGIGYIKIVFLGDNYPLYKAYLVEQLNIYQIMVIDPR